MTTLIQSRSKNLNLGNFSIPKSSIQDFRLCKIEVPIYKGEIKNQKTSIISKIKKVFQNNKSSMKKESYELLQNWEIKKVKMLIIRMGKSTVNFGTTLPKEDIVRTNKIFNSINSEDLPKLVQNNKTDFQKYLKTMDTYGMVKKDLKEVNGELEMHFSERGITVTSK